jgi:hypothetical protein
LTAAVTASPPGKPVSFSCFNDIPMCDNFLDQSISSLITSSSSNNYFSLSLKDLRVVISSLEAFASQYTSLEGDKARLQKEVKSSSPKMEGAIKMAVEALQEVDSLKDELEGLKKRLKDEEVSRLAAEVRVTEKYEILRQSSLALLSNTLSASFLIFALSIRFWLTNSSPFTFSRSCRHPC